jgi:hypothetical protein
MPTGGCFAHHLWAFCPAPIDVLLHLCMHDVSDVKASRPEWPWGQKSWPRPRDPLASAVIGLGLKTVASGFGRNKRMHHMIDLWLLWSHDLSVPLHISQFGHHKTSSDAASDTYMELAKQLPSYIDKINSPFFDSTNTSLGILTTSNDLCHLGSLFERVFCVPVISALVERVFSQSRLIMTRHRAKMSNALLESLVFLKCNSEL